MGTAQVEQHAVAPGHRDDLEPGDAGAVRAGTGKGVVHLCHCPGERVLAACMRECVNACVQRATCSALPQCPIDENYLATPLFATVQSYGVKRTV